MRLIDADALKGQIRETIKVYKTNGKFDEPLKRFCNMLRQEIEAIDNAPTIDAEPVVRCKDCKYRGIIDYPVCCESTDEWFCADGERKGGDTE